MVQPISVPIPDPWVGMAWTQPVPAPLQQSEGCKVSTSTPAGATESQPWLLATTQATRGSLPPLSGCDVIVSDVLSPPGWCQPSTKPFKSLRRWPCSQPPELFCSPYHCSANDKNWFILFLGFQVPCFVFCFLQFRFMELVFCETLKQWRSVLICSALCFWVHISTTILTPAGLSSYNALLPWPLSLYVFFLLSRSSLNSLYSLSTSTQ